MPVSEYFLDNPDMVLGTLRAVNGAYNADDLVVTPDGDTVQALEQALGRIASAAASRALTWTPGPAAGTSAAAPLPGPRSAHPDGYLQAQADGTFTQVAGGQVYPFPVPDSQGAELRQLLGLRDAVTGLLEAEAASLDDSPELERRRRDLNARYDSYLRGHGPIGRFSWRRTGRTRPRDRRGETRPRPAAARRVPVRPVRAPGAGTGTLRSGQPDRGEGRHLHRARRRSPQPPPGRRQPGRRAGDLPGRLRRGAAGRDRPAARHQRGTGPPRTRHPGLR